VRDYVKYEVRYNSWDSLVCTLISLGSSFLFQLCTSLWDLLFSAQNARASSNSMSGWENDALEERRKVEMEEEAGQTGSIKSSYIDPCTNTEVLVHFFPESSRNRKRSQKTAWWN
jgi:hypothetical protein